MSFLLKSSFTFATQFLVILASISSGIIVARILGPELKGQAALLTMLSQLLFMACSMGFGSAFSFHIAKKRFSSQQIHTFAFISSLSFGAIGILVFYVTWPLHAPVWGGIDSRLIFLSALLSIVLIYSNYLIRILVGYGYIISMNISRLMNSLSNFIGVIVFLLVFGYGLAGMVASFWLSALSQTAISLYVLRNDLKPRKFWGKGLIYESFSYGIQSHALLLINFLNYRVDMLLLKYYTNDEAVGFYSLAVTIAEMMWMIPNSTVAPLFSEVAQSESDARSIVTMRTVRWSLLFLILMAVLGIPLVKPFIAILYGNAFLPSYYPFLWLLPGICLFPIFKLLTVDLSARGFPGYGTVASAIALIVNIGANIILIPTMGPSGAAIATSFSYVCMSMFAIYFFLKVTHCGMKDIFIIDRQELKFIFNAIKNVGSKKLGF